MLRNNNNNNNNPAGVAFGLIYLPSIVSVGYYFTTKRGIATGIAVCGSGMGAFLFSPIVQTLLQHFHWKITMIFMAGKILIVTVYGCLMRPLAVDSVEDREIDNTLQLGASFSSAISNTSAKPAATEKGKGKSAQPKIFDFQILKLPAMMILSISNLFGMSGYYIPYFYIADFATNSVKRDGKVFVGS